MGPFFRSLLSWVLTNIWKRSGRRSNLMLFDFYLELDAGNTVNFLLSIVFNTQLDQTKQEDLVTKPSKVMLSTVSVFAVVPERERHQRVSLTESLLTRVLLNLNSKEV